MSKEHPLTTWTLPPLTVKPESACTINAARNMPGRPSRIPEARWNAMQKQITQAANDDPRTRYGDS